MTISDSDNSIIPNFQFILQIDVIDVWYRICSQRKNILNDTNVLQQSMQIVLQCCREFIKKRKLIPIMFTTMQKLKINGNTQNEPFSTDHSGSAKIHSPIFGLTEAKCLA